VTSTPAATRRARPLRRGLSSLLVVALLSCALAPHAPAAAQSGRRKTERQSPVPQPTPDETKPAPAAAKNISIVASFVVYEDENVNLSTVMSQRNLVGKNFYDRLRQSPSVEVSLGGRGTRGEARDRAKKETKAHVVLLLVEEDLSVARDPRQRDRLGRTDPGDYAIRVSVYAPTTGDLKYNDVIHPRPYRSAGTVGGIPVPVPVGRLPGEYQLMQAARDAADRLLARFEIARPPEN